MKVKTELSLFTSRWHTGRAGRRADGQAGVGEGADVELCSFLTLAIVGSKWSASRSGRFTHAKEHDGHCIRGGVKVSYRTGLESFEGQRVSCPF